ncbi:MULTISPECIES: hypothetical protein [Pseudarthrobacter]|uniref:hypothetical protein n=1 Tax=Pseudarthrobacter TaxID=1742993 RepID=UPI0013D9980B|nr:MULTISPECIES: hypothetical protein [Pseudarthrobacter]MDP9999592.1 putative integral membrane protein [Pseudarthrobacter sulfonivorans]
MSYERNLTFNLRLRGLSEAEIAEAMAEVRAHADAAGTPAAAEFGPDEYARQFPKQKRKTRGSAIAKAGLLLAIAYLLFAVLLMAAFRVDIRDFVGPVTLLPAVAVILVSLLAGFLTDYIRPVRDSRAAR